MAYKNIKAHALGHIGAATTSTNTNSCLCIACGRATLGQLLCDISCIVNDNHSKNQSLTSHRYLKST